MYTTHFRQQALCGTLPRDAVRGPIPEEMETESPAGELSGSRRGSSGPGGGGGGGGGVAVIEQSGRGAASEPVQGGQLRRSQDGRISLR